MEIERKLADFVTETRFEDLPEEPVEVARKLVLVNLGTIIAGAADEGCETLVNQVKEWGGRPEATILIHGGRVPAYNAAFVNSVMARALDFDDGMVPGIHMGASAVPTALAIAELAGGCSGKELLTALVVGCEVTSRLVNSAIPNLKRVGFDPTGICTIFATAAAAGRILRLDRNQMLHALALAFNRAGGSFQSNVDGSLAVRFIQGFVSEAGVVCAQLAQKNITGPQNFVEGVFGFFNLYAGDLHDATTVLGELGQRFDLTNDMFKRFPNCGSTMSSTDAIYDLVHEKNLAPEDVVGVDIRVTPHSKNLVGKTFEIGENPRVNAQFSIQYCVANVLLRKDSRLEHFEPAAIKDPRIMEIVPKVHVEADPSLEPRGQLALEMQVRTTSGEVYHKSVDIPRGFPGNPLSKAEQVKRFQQCIDYAPKPPSKANVDKLVSMIDRLEDVEDVRSLVPLLSD